MDQPMDPKIAKKLLKAQVKAEKKRAKLAAESSSAPPAAELSSAPGTPADRSAAAAERQVRLQRWRVAIALLTLAVAAVTFLLTVRPWEAKQGESAETTADQSDAD